MVAGITKPTSGTVKVQGRISALIELGAGFHPEISGRENVYINGIMLGLTKREIARRFDEIVEFAELQDFIDAPVKTYSSGMYMRLGFAVAIHVDPDVLLVDEVLAVGDEGFTHKCLDKFGEFRRRGKTVLLVTHSLGLVERFCDEVLWLDGGQAQADGDPRRVVGMYVTAVERSEERQLARDDQRARRGRDRARRRRWAPRCRPTPSRRPKSRPTCSARPRAAGARARSRSRGVTLRARTASPGHVFQSGERMTIKLDVKANEPLTDFVFGVGLFNADGVCVYGTNTDVEQFRPDSLSGEGVRRVHRRRARSRRRHLQAGRRRPQARRLPLRLPPVAVHLPREVADQGRRHLPAAAPVGVHAAASDSGCRSIEYADGLSRLSEPSRP